MQYIPYIIGCVIALVVLIAVFILCKKGYKAEIAGTVYALVCRAEVELEGSKRGQEKKALVIKRLHEMLPAWAALLISEKDIDNLIDLAVEQMKRVLAEAAAEK